MAGINAVVDPTSTPDVGWGLSFIGGAADACDLGAVASLVGANDSLALPLARASTSDGRLALIGNRPTRGAIERAAQLLAAEGQLTPRMILLITDGFPFCSPDDPDPQDIDAAGTQTAIIDALANGTVTSVVGLAKRTSSRTTTSATWRSPAAARCSGGPAEAGYPLYFPASSSGDLVSAMQTILASVDCIYPVPAPPTNDGTTSPSDINVVAEIQTIFQDANNGWTYTDAAQTGIQLHGTSCATVRATGAAVSVIFNCNLI